MRRVHPQTDIAPFPGPRYGGLPVQSSKQQATLASSPSPVGEPVAWQWRLDPSCEWQFGNDPDWHRERGGDVRPLYATPQPDADRETVERLTRDEEVRQRVEKVIEEERGHIQNMWAQKARAETAETALAAAQETIGRLTKGIRQALEDVEFRPGDVPDVPLRYMVFHEDIRALQSDATGEKGERAVSSLPSVTQEEASPVIRLEGIDEYGPRLGWHIPWTSFAVGTEFCVMPPREVRR